MARENTPRRSGAQDGEDNGRMIVRTYVERNRWRRVAIVVARDDAAKVARAIEGDAGLAARGAT